MKSISLASVTALLLLLVACTKAAPAVPTAIFPDREAPDHRHHAYSMTESPDGTIRIYTQEEGDDARLYEMHRTGKTWSEPVPMDLPTRHLLKGASFSREDGSLYFATDAAMPLPIKGKDLNIWRVEWDGSAWGEAKPVEGDINTGGNETIASVAADGTMIFASNRREVDEFGYGLCEAHRDASGAWKLSHCIANLNDMRTDDHVVITADGSRLFYYSHRTPTLGGVDIWTSTRLADGTWSDPVNPGPPLNSDKNEFGPGLSGDGKTLFFSRNGVLMEVSLKAVLEGLEAR